MPKQMVIQIALVLHRKALRVKHYFIFAPLICSVGTVGAHFRHTHDLIIQIPLVLHIYYGY